MKKEKYIVLLFIFVLIMLSGCNNLESQVKTPNKDPEPIDIATPVPLEFEMESDYGNIISKTELPIYSKDTEKIIYTITNNNVGKGFYYFSIPCIEYYDNNKWIRLTYYPPDYTQEAERWNICGIEGNNEIQYSCNGAFFPQSVSEGIGDGLYRLVIFVGDKKVYAEFKFKD